MKTERRHELQKNELADWLAVKLAQAQNYSGAIWASVLAIVVLVAVGMYLSRRSADQTAAAWEQLFTASDTNNTEQLQQLADRVANTSAGKWARLRLADGSLYQGINQLFQEPAEARKSLASAADGYRWLREHAGDDLLEERATLGLAKTYESQDKLDEARKEYDKLLKESPKSVYASEAKSRLRDLDKKSTREFYDWFAAREIKPPSSEPGVPGLKPKFDASSLPPDDSGIKFEHATQASGTDKGPALTPTKEFDKLRATTVPGDQADTVPGDQATTVPSDQANTVPGDKAATAAPAADGSSKEPAGQTPPAKQAPPATQEAAPDKTNPAGDNPE